MLKERTTEIKLYIGSRIGYHGETFKEEKLIEVIGDFQEKYPFNTPVRLTKTKYIDGHYNEDGWEISVINYPRKARTKAQLLLFCEELIHVLLVKLKQNRMTMVTRKFTKIFETES